MPRLQAKSFAKPDEVRALTRSEVTTVTLDDSEIGYCTFEPGWRWSADVGPIFGFASCPIRHAGYVMSGTVRVEMDDGQALEIGAGSVFEIPPGHDKWVVGEEPWVTIEWGGSGRAYAAALLTGGTQSLATVMFTDIVDSTARAQEFGNDRWQLLLARHNELLRADLNVFRGREVKTTGDGFLAVFDSPSRAVRCAAAMVRSTAALGLEIRIGVHTGEIETRGDDVRGIAVNTAARVTAVAGAGEVLVSASTAETLDAADLRLEDAGWHELKGLAGPRHLYRLVMPAA